MGELFWAVLVYPGNSFEGYYYVNDPALKAYTVFYPNGPFESQYFRLEVLRSAFGPAPTKVQYWVWKMDQTINGQSVIRGDRVPVPNILVPEIP